MSVALIVGIGNGSGTVVRCVLHTERGERS